MKNILYPQMVLPELLAAVNSTVFQKAVEEFNDRYELIVFSNCSAYADMVVSMVALSRKTEHTADMPSSVLVGEYLDKCERVFVVENVSKGEIHIPYVLYSPAQGSIHATYRAQFHDPEIFGQLLVDTVLKGHYGFLE